MAHGAIIDEQKEFIQSKLDEIMGKKEEPRPFPHKIMSGLILAFAALTIGRTLQQIG